MPLFAVVSLQNLCVFAGSHVPSEGLAYSAVNPFEAARELKTCFNRLSTLYHRPFSTSPESEWAGLILQNDSTPVIAGPIVPKVGSRLLRAIFGDKDRPLSLTQLAPFLENQTRESELTSKKVNEDERSDSKFWFAVVRDPLTQFVDAYVESGAKVRDVDGCEFGAKDPK